MILKDNIVK